MSKQEAILIETSDKERNLQFADFLDLFSRPRLFFSGRLILKETRYLWFVVWSLGIAGQFDRIDQAIVREEMGMPSGTWLIVEPLVTSGWIAYWMWSIGVGLITAAIIYLIGGWWYKVRLRFSGAVDPDPTRARLIYCYSTFVSSLPHLLLTVGWTFAYSSYYDAYHSDELFSLSLPFFAFWSVAVSYSGATTAFSPTLWKARVWFLVLPVAFYIAVLGGVAWLMTLFQ